jgi:hypothetical protein
MFSFSLSRLFPSCSSPPYNPTMSADNKSSNMDRRIADSIDKDAMAMDRPTIQEVERWDATKLAKWIQQVLDPSLDPDDAEIIIQAKINGRVFLEGAGDRTYFRDAGLSFGASVELARLAKGVTSTAIQGKLLSSIPYSKY